MNDPLRHYLLEALPEVPIDLDEHEIITDAVVLFRVVDVASGGERYRYTTTGGMSLGMAVGIIKLSQTTLLDYYTRLLAEEDEEEDS